MSRCRICNVTYYHETYYEPKEPCLCGHGVNGESPWQYAGWRGVFAHFKYVYLSRWFESVTSPVAEWLFSSWKY